MKKYVNKSIKHKSKNNNLYKKSDPRKHPRPGYDEKNPTKNIQEHPENQNTG